MLKIAYSLGITVSELLQVDLDKLLPSELSSGEKSKRLISIFQDLPMDVTEKLYDAITAKVKRK